MLSAAGQACVPPKGGGVVVATGAGVIGVAGGAGLTVGIMVLGFIDGVIDGLMVGVMVALPVGIPVGGAVTATGRLLNRTTCAHRKWWRMRPVTITRSPRAICLAAMNVGCLAGIIVIGVPACDAIVWAADMVVGITVAVDGVIVIVSITLVPATATLKVTGLNPVVFIAATFRVPAMVAAAGAMLFCIAALVAGALPVIAAVPRAEAATFMTCVLAVSSHRCSVLFDDFTSSQCRVARATTPRCMATVPCGVRAVAKFLTGAAAIACMDLPREVVQLDSAVLRACWVLIRCWKIIVYPASRAAGEVELLAAIATAPIAPPPASTAAARPTRALMLAWRMPRMLRPIICGASFRGGRARHGLPRTSLRALRKKEPVDVNDFETAPAAPATASNPRPGNHHVRQLTIPERTGAVCLAQIFHADDSPVTSSPPWEALHALGEGDT